MVPQKLVTICLLLLFPVAARADYYRQKFPEAIASSENCVLGTIVRLDTSYFWLEVDKSIYGDIKEKTTIPILRFQNWSCAHRHSKYRVGEREIVLVNKSNNVISEFDYCMLCGGDEWELPVIDDRVIYLHWKNDTFLITDFITGVIDFRKLRDSCKRTNLLRKVPVDILKEFAGRSPAHAVLAGYRQFLPPMEWEIDQGVPPSRPDAAAHSTSSSKHFNIVDPKIVIEGSEDDTLRTPPLGSVFDRLISLSEPKQLQYVLLTFSADIIKPTGETRTFRSRNAMGNQELNINLRRMQNGDKIRIYNVQVQYPDKAIHYISEKTVYVEYREEK